MKCCIQANSIFMKNMYVYKYTYKKVCMDINTAFI